MDLGLTDRRAIVTGGSKGLGFAAATDLVKEGARVVICSRTEDEVLRAAAELNEIAHDAGFEGERAWGFTADMRDAESITVFIDQAVQALGGIDILINNAGGAHPGTGQTMADEAIIADYAIKVLSWHRTLRAALPHLRESDQARVINVGSVFAHTPDYRFYSTSVNRAAGNNLTKAWAAELGADGILVNAINIGTIATPQWENIKNKRAPELSLDEFMAKTAREDIPLQRVGRAEEFGAVATFLASARASYVTGAEIDVAGGMGIRF